MKLIEQLRSKKAASDKAAWAEYRKILARADAPREKDVDRLAELVGQLGIHPDHLALHVLILSEAENLKADSAKVSEREAAIETSEKSMLAEQARFRPLVQEHQARIAESREVRKAAEMGLDSLRAASSVLDSLGRQYAGLFGVSDPKPFPEDYGPKPTTPAIRDMMNELGLK